MSAVLAVCTPSSDAVFGERVRHVVSQDRWDLDSPEGVALFEALLRQTYPMVTVLPHGVSAGSVRRTIALDVHRDGAPGPVDPRVVWAGAVYDRIGAAAYAQAARILGEGPAANAVVETAFREVCRSAGESTTAAAGATAVEATVVRLATEARGAAGEAPAAATEALPGVPLVGESVRRHGVRTALTAKALGALLSAQRDALELSVLEGLKVPQIADRMRTTPRVVHDHLRDGLLAIRSGARPTAQATLARWRDAEREWALLPSGHGSRAQTALAVAHAWLDYQVASGSLGSETVVLVTNAEREFVAASGNAGVVLGRPSVVGVQIDDITASYARSRVPELWNLFDASGSMQGDYDCDRPGQPPLRVPFRGVWGRPLPDLQVGYLEPGAAAPVASRSVVSPA